jgi:uncharacterized RDD family membrane protein YckC
MKQQMRIRYLMVLLLASASLQVRAQGILAGSATSDGNSVSMSAIAINYREGLLLSEPQAIAVADDDRAKRNSQRSDWRQRRGTGNDRVAIGSNAELPAGETSDSVVAIVGDANVAGDVSDAVVAIFGNTMVDGNVGESVVTMFGDSYVNSRVGESVVTMFGNVELGPQAVIDGDLVTIGGTVKRDPAAVVHRMQNIMPLDFSVDFGWFRTWMKECLFYGRLLAFQPGLVWAWSVAIVSLLLYVLTAALVPHTVEKCVNTLETWPGRSLLAALLSIPLIPVLMLLLVITIIGMLAIPVVGLALLTALWFGKLIMLGWIGRRLLQAFKMQEVHWALAVLVGGVIATLLYTVPVIGLLSYKLLQFIGFGAVLYTLLLMFRKPALQTGRSGTPSSNTAAFTPTGVSDSGGEAAPNTVQAGTTPDADTPEHATPAGFWPRMAALAVDVVLVAIISNMLNFNMFNFGGVLEHSLLLSLAIYGAVMWKFKGSTVGGIVFHLQVQRIDGRELDWPTTVVRALSCFLSLMALGLGFIWIAIDSEKQAWHDKIAGTRVVRLPKGKSLV